jgi:hypothetical protein
LLRKSSDARAISPNCAIENLNVLAEYVYSGHSPRSRLPKLVHIHCGPTNHWYYTDVSSNLSSVTVLTRPRYKGCSTWPSTASCSELPDEDVPHITILRPIKGLDPWLYECLASAFQLDYPLSKVTIYICVPSRSDPAFPVLEQLLANFPRLDARIFVGAEEDVDASASDPGPDTRGLNPKIRNRSRAYIEAPSDIVWIVDCNVWIGRGTAGRMVEKLCGYGPNVSRVQACRFVHQLPIVVEVKDNAIRGFGTPHSA